MATTEKRTRYGHGAKDIAQDFAEQLKYTFDADVYHTTEEARYQALAMAIRDRVIHQWDISRKTQRAKSAKRVYYLSLEFLMGRAMTTSLRTWSTRNPTQDLETEASDALQPASWTLWPHWRFRPTAMESDTITVFSTSR